MKATKGPEKEVAQQLKGAQCFIGYCREIGRTFWSSPDFLEGYRNRFVKLRLTNGSKRPTKVSEQQGAHHTPENMLKINGQNHLQFNHLAGK